VRYHVRVTNDGGDGAYVSWADGRPGAEVRASHLDGDGRPANGWQDDGTPISDQVESAGPVVRVLVPIVNLVPDGFGNAYVVWQRDDAIPEHILLMKLLPAGPAASTSGEARIGTARGARPASAVSPSALEIRMSAGTNVPSLELSLPDPTSARLELLDVMGRRMWSREVASLGTGKHTVRLAEIPRIPKGVYLVRLTQGAKSATARVAIVR